MSRLTGFNAITGGAEVRPRKEIRYLDHTADAAFEVRAASPAALLETAAEALSGLICDPAGISERDSIEISVEEAVDLDDLLVRFLSELLYLHETGGWLFASVEVGDIGDFHVEATVLGERYDPKRHELRSQVKAVTYHGLNVVKEGGVWTATVVLDL